MSALVRCAGYMSEQNVHIREVSLKIFWIQKTNRRYLDRCPHFEGVLGNRFQLYTSVSSALLLLGS